MPQPLEDTKANETSGVAKTLDPAKAATAGKPKTKTAGPDKWEGNRHRPYMDATLKALCDLACEEGRITFSTMLQRAARKYVRNKARDLRKRLAALPAAEQARLSEALQTLFTK